MAGLFVCWVKVKQTGRHGKRRLRHKFVRQFKKRKKKDFITQVFHMVLPAVFFEKHLSKSYYITSFTELMCIKRRKCSLQYTNSRTKFIKYDIFSFNPQLWGKRGTFWHQIYSSAKAYFLCLHTVIEMLLSKRKKKKKEVTDFWWGLVWQNWHFGLTAVTKFRFFFFSFSPPGCKTWESFPNLKIRSLSVSYTCSEASSLFSSLRWWLQHQRKHCVAAAAAPWGVERIDLG